MLHDSFIRRNGNGIGVRVAAVEMLSPIEDKSAVCNLTLEIDHNKEDIIIIMRTEAGDDGHIMKFVPIYKYMNSYY